MTTAPYHVVSPKKLIEVALPLDAINVASAREKSIRQGHPSTFHLWWARRPLAAARAVIFSQLVHDPEDLWRHQNPGKEPNTQVKGHWTKARARLFTLIEDLVKWENTTNELVLTKAREEIRKSWTETCQLNKEHPQATELFNPDLMPGLHDPFAGGGTIPIEAQRLGLEAFASDLNPVAVTINKAMREIPPKFAGKAPVNPNSKHDNTMIARHWAGASGLAEDVRYYGQWMRDEGFKLVGHFYPTIKITNVMTQHRPDLKAYEGENLTIIAWLWARTVKSPNPAFSHVEVPLASTFSLSTKLGKEAYVEPIVKEDNYRFIVNVGKPPAEAHAGTKVGRGDFRCIMSNAPIDAEYIREQGRSGFLKERLMAIVAEGKHGRVYLSPTEEQEAVARSASPPWMPDVEFFQQALGFRIGNYGLTKWSDAFTKRQLHTMATLCDLVESARAKVLSDATELYGTKDDRSLEDDGRGARAYSEAVSVYLSLCVSRLANRCSSLCFWDNKGENVQQVFARQALTMIFDTVEANPFSSSTGNFIGQQDYLIRALEFSIPAIGKGHVLQQAAQSQTLSRNRFVSTDPPYYDNIGYADLSDFFYVWIRHSLRPIMPGLFSSIATPKSEELVATPHRHGGRLKAEQFFLSGMTEAFRNVTTLAHPGSLITIFYAFRQSETSSTEGTFSTGWETFLQALIDSGLAISGTWPVRTEYTSNLKTQRNALASSVVIVCKARKHNATSVSRRQFIRELNGTLPIALDAMTRESEGLHSPVAPVDLSQAIIGPGMAVFSKYAAVLEADGSPMTIRTALQLINRFLAEDDFDADTQFCLHWFEQYGWETSKFGEADTLARAKGTSVDGVKQAGVLHASIGNVRLLKWAEYSSEWDPQSDQRLPIWEVLHQLIRVFNTDGESGAAAVFAAVQSKAEAARQLAYRLYTLCERKSWAEDARAYNEVVTSWTGIESAAAKVPTPTQRKLFD